MNKFIQAVKALDTNAVRELLAKETKWLRWAEDNGKNALHFLCGLPSSGDPRKQEAGLEMLKLLLGSGMDIDSVHRIPEKCGFFPATPLWYAYTRGRNAGMVAYLLEAGAQPDHCMFAIAWNDDAESAELFRSHGAIVDSDAFLAAFAWRRFTVAEWFLRSGANPNAADSNGNTALHLAVKRGYKLEQVRLLLEYGADSQLANREGLSASQLAVNAGRKKMAELFGMARPTRV